MEPGNPQHYNRKPLRNAEFITPPNTLKTKVGSGGLSEEILDKAERLLENNSVDFMPLGELYLNNLMKGIDRAKDADARTLSPQENEALIAAMIYPAMQLKANGGMFRYQLVTQIADRLVQFLEVIIRADIDALEIVLAFHATIRAVVLGKISGDGGKYGSELIRALDEACHRYFERHTDLRGDMDYTYVERG